MQQYHENNICDFNNRYDNPSQIICNNKKSSSSQNIFQTQVNSKYNNDINEMQPELIPIDSKRIYNNLRNPLIISIRGNYSNMEMENEINKAIYNNCFKPKHPSRKPRSSIPKGWNQNKFNYLQISRQSKDSKEQAFKEKRLQRDLSGYQREFSMRVKQISLIRAKVKISKISKLANSLYMKTDEFIKIKKALDELQDDLDENEQTIAHYQSRLEFHKEIAIQATEQLKITAKLVYDSEDKRELLEKSTSKLERKIRAKDSHTKQLKNQLKDLNYHIEKVNKENELLEGICYEKESYELNDEENAKTIKNLIEHNEELSNEIAKEEKIQANYNERLAKHEKERPKLFEKTKEPPSAYKEKEKKINELLEEINKYIEDEKKVNKTTEEKIILLNEELDQLKQINTGHKQSIDKLNSNIEHDNRAILNLRETLKKREADVSKQSSVVILEMNEIKLDETPNKEGEEKEEEQEEEEEEMEISADGDNNKPPHEIS